MEIQRDQKEVLSNISEAKEFDSIRQDKQNHKNVRYKRQRLIENCTYCGTGHPQAHYLACGKICSECGKANHF